MKRVLFLCTGNACRSQMAEGWAKTLLAGKVEAFSAGTRPEREVEARAVKVMAESGVDISGQKPKSLEIFKGDDFDLVVTLCDNAREACPVYWGKAEKIHSGFSDPVASAEKGAPEEEIMAHYRRVRDGIRDFIKKLPEIMEGME